VETTRDLGDFELWQQSLERSLARRGKLARSSIELYRLQPERDLAAREILLESSSYWQTRRLAAASRPAIPRPVVGLGGLSALALVTATTLPGLLSSSRHRGGQHVAFTAAATATAPQALILGNGQGRSASPVPAAPKPTHTHATVTAKPVAVTTADAPDTQTVPPKTTTTTVHRSAPRTHTVKVAAKPATHSAKPAVATPVKPAPKPAAPKPTTAPKPAATTKPAPKPAPARKPAPKPAAPSSGYVNPLAHASVTPERIDQGVDYAGTGTLTSIGRARVTYVATTGTGWPGAFIEYQLLNGRYAGRYVYYAEGVRPASGISVGRVVGAGQAVASLIPGWSTGIEIGWAAGIGTETYAAAHGEHTYPTAAGESFSALIASLGGPPGR
jgi:hypothetical protein